MGMSFGSRLKHAWNAFTGTDYTTYQDVGPGYSSRPDRIRLTKGNERPLSLLCITGLLWTLRR